MTIEIIKIISIILVIYVYIYKVYKFIATYVEKEKGYETKHGFCYQLINSLFHSNHNSFPEFVQVKDQKNQWFKFISRIE